MATAATSGIRGREALLKLNFKVNMGGPYWKLGIFDRFK
jgi:hypothetical protein